MQPENTISQDNEPNDADRRDQTGTPEVEGEESEFKLTVRKLELPVRPRGVLAE